MRVPVGARMCRRMAAIDAGKEILPHHENQPQRGQTKAEKADAKDAPARQQQAEQHDIGGAQPLEAGVEGVIEALEEICAPQSRQRRVALPASAASSRAMVGTRVRDSM